jgi:integrase
MTNEPNPPFPQDVDPPPPPAPWFLEWAKSNLATGPGFEANRSTLRVYGSMWGSFVSHLREARGVDPSAAGPQDAASFMDDVRRRAKAEHHARYARVLGRAYLALAEADPALSAVAAGFLAPQAGMARNEPKTFLSACEREELFAVLAQPSDFGSKSGQVDARSKAMCGLMLGAGFKPGELLAAVCGSVNCALATGRAQASAPLMIEGRGVGRSVELDPRAWPAVSAWLADRNAEPGALLFPAEKPLGAPAGRALDYATAFVGVKLLLASAGIGAPPSRSAARRRKSARGESPATRPRASPQTLRNSFGAQLLERGGTTEDLMRAMGFARMSFARRFERAHQAWLRGEPLSETPDA